MKNRILLLGVLISILAQPSFALQLSTMTSPQATLEQVFQDYQVTDFSKPEIETLVVGPDGGCSPFYYVEIRFPGTFENQPYRVELDLQTLTPENMNRIAHSIQTNYAKYGLPECVRSDTYDTQDWITDETKKILMIPASMKGDHHTCYDPGFLLPYTQCVNVTDLYPQN